MKKIIIFIFVMILLCSCSKSTSYKLENIDFIEEYHDQLFYTAQPHYKYSITLSKNNVQKSLIISVDRKIDNIQSGDSVCLRKNDLILKK
ncbi:MAG: hypothetical protein J1F35_06310 [Erysipelotrichales bacterium]|nr:hypothetical protein [Erysipelotrichales bacterium]